MRRSSLVQRLFSLALVIWGIDFLTKNWAIENLSSSSRQIIGSFLQLTLLRNPGAAFSMATGFTIVFTSISIAVVIFIARYASRITSTWWAYVGGLVLGGVLGNLTDRIFREPGFLYGHVIDWIELPHWPIFNVADSSIFIAAGIAILLTIKNISPTAKSGSDE
ncbi:LspA Lipoprotein signal peptidase [Candidatus Nanopelagicaceae bacterium]